MRRIVEEETQAGSIGFRPNLGLPQRVSGAIDIHDVLHLQKLKQELFDDVYDF